MVNILNIAAGAGHAQTATEPARIQARQRQAELMARAEQADLEARANERERYFNVVTERGKALGEHINSIVESAKPGSDTGPLMKTVVSSAQGTMMALRHAEESYAALGGDPKDLQPIYSGIQNAMAAAQAKFSAAPEPETPDAAGTREGIAKIAELEAMLGRPLTPDERTRAAGVESPQDVGDRFARVVSGDDPLNAQFSLGIPRGESARVEFDADESGGLTNPSVLARFGASVEAQPLQDPIAGGLSDVRVERISEISEAGARAATAGQLFGQLAQNLSDPRLQTGVIPTATTGLQALFDDVGVDLQAVAQNLFGVDIGNLVNKQQFVRLSAEGVVHSFEDFKGNLNQEEVRIAEDAFANIGASEDANIDAIAAGLAAQEIARRRAIQANNVQTTDEAVDLLNSLLSGGADEFHALKARHKAEITSARDDATKGDGEGIESPEGFRFLEFRTINGVPNIPVFVDENGFEVMPED